MAEEDDIIISEYDTESEEQYGGSGGGTTVGALGIDDLITYSPTNSSSSSSYTISAVPRLFYNSVKEKACSQLPEYRIYNALNFILQAMTEPKIVKNKYKFLRTSKIFNTVLSCITPVEETSSIAFSGNLPEELKEYDSGLNTPQSPEIKIPDVLSSRYSTDCSAKFRPDYREDNLIKLLYIIDKTIVNEAVKQGLIPLSSVPDTNYILDPDTGQRK